MGRELTRAVLGPGQPPQTFWTDDLELPLANILTELEDPDLLEQWWQGLTGRQLQMLRRNAGDQAKLSTRAARTASAIAMRTKITHYLVARFTRFKSKVAVSNLAKTVLDATTLTACQLGETGEFDILALVFAVYGKDWNLLPLVLCWDNVHKKGFARMKLAARARKPNISLEKFLTDDRVIKILDQIDKKRHDNRLSTLKRIVRLEDRQFVFIRRAERHNLIMVRSHLVHGHAREWIILDFFDHAKRVNISSVSIGVSLEIANSIATKYFGKECEYENEHQETAQQQIVRFLKTLCDGQDKELALVEIVVRSSPLEGAPKIKITDSGSRPIGRAIYHFEKSVGKVLTQVDRIESIKVLYRKKRVSLIFTSEPPGGLSVAYSDHRLNANERGKFEKHVKEKHGITIVSTEKQHKRDR